MNTAAASVQSHITPGIRFVQLQQPVPPENSHRMYSFVSPATTKSRTPVHEWTTSPCTPPEITISRPCEVHSPQPEPKSQKHYHHHHYHHHQHESSPSHPSPTPQQLQQQEQPQQYFFRSPVSASPMSLTPTWPSADATNYNGSNNSPLDTSAASFHRTPHRRSTKPHAERNMKSYYKHAYRPTTKPRSANAAHRRHSNSFVSTALASQASSASCTDEPKSRLRQQTIPTAVDCGMQPVMVLNPASTSVPPPLQKAYKRHRAIHTIPAASAQKARHHKIAKQAPKLQRSNGAVSPSNMQCYPYYLEPASTPSVMPMMTYRLVYPPHTATKKHGTHHAGRHRRPKQQQHDEEIVSTMPTRRVYNRRPLHRKVKPSKLIRRQRSNPASVFSSDDMSGAKMRGRSIHRPQDCIPLSVSPSKSHLKRAVVKNRHLQDRHSEATVSCESPLQLVSTAVSEKVPRRKESIYHDNKYVTNGHRDNNKYVTPQHKQQAYRWSLRSLSTATSTDSTPWPEVKQNGGAAAESQISKVSVAPTHPEPVTKLWPTTAVGQPLLYGSENLTPEEMYMKFKPKRRGFWYGCNACFCGACDRPGGCCSGFNCCGCCDREFLPPTGCCSRQKTMDTNDYRQAVTQRKGKYCCSVD